MLRRGKCNWEMAAMPLLSWRTSPRRCIEDVRLFVNLRCLLTCLDFKLSPCSLCSMFSFAA